MNHFSIFPPARRVIHSEARQWLSENQSRQDWSVMTSLPDRSEFPNLEVNEWSKWFEETAKAIIDWVKPPNFAIFFQTDIRIAGKMIHKGQMILNAASAANGSVLWHKIVCRNPPGTISYGRPNFSHMICIAKQPKTHIRRMGPDVIADGGQRSWSRGIGERGCRTALHFVRNETTSRTIVNPFCGHGSILAVANELGFHAIGIDHSIRCCRFARNADVLFDPYNPPRSNNAPQLSSELH